MALIAGDHCDAVSELSGLFTKNGTVGVPWYHAL
jgi:hypothetical protein